LPKPFFVLAPMDDVTDTVFRQMVIKMAKPDLFITEFVNADGFCSKGRSRVERKLQFTPAEQPLVAQIWGLKPENFATLTKEIKARGFAGVDINMGCPEKKVVKRGACAALIANPELAGQIIDAVKGAAGNLPVSVKTRIGFREVATVEWISFLLKFNLDAITVHTRTASQMSKVSAQHDELTKVVALRDKISPKTLIIANGDIASREQGEEIVKKYGVDGVMIGRGIFHNPFVFAKKLVEISSPEMLKLLREHIDLHEQTWGKTRDYQALKRFYKVYVNSFEGAPELRDKLMLTKNHQQARDILANFVVKKPI
jgi:tRNA-dihydrouridine synthase